MQIPKFKVGEKVVYADMYYGVITCIQKYNGNLMYFIGFDIGCYDKSLRKPTDKELKTYFL